MLCNMCYVLSFQISSDVYAYMYSTNNDLLLVMYL